MSVTIESGGQRAGHPYLSIAIGLIGRRRDIRFRGCTVAALAARAADRTAKKLGLLMGLLREALTAVPLAARRRR